MVFLEKNVTEAHETKAKATPSSSLPGRPRPGRPQQSQRFDFPFYTSALLFRRCCSSHYKNPHVQIFFKRAVAADGGREVSTSAGLTVRLTEALNAAWAR